MNEEQTVLDFFSSEENFTLALIAAEHLDQLRQNQNNNFWEALIEKLKLHLDQNTLPWEGELTEDRNSEDTLVGLHLNPKINQRNYLLPFMEQQLIGNTYRIYFGLMWNVAPEPIQKNLPEVETLRKRFSTAGFKNSDSFLAWQWSSWYPRRKDFLIKFVSNKENLLAEVMQPWESILHEFNNDILRANLALNNAPNSAAISLSQLHDQSNRKG